MEEDEVLRYKGINCVPNSQELKNLILGEMHNVPYVGHPGYQKTIAVVKNQYYWPSMKKENDKFIAKFLACQKVKAKHIHPASLLHPLPILEWKWEVVKIDFITKLPKKNKPHDSIMVVVDNLTKASHFITVKITLKEASRVHIYLKEIYRLHGMPKSIVFDRDPKFTSKFCQGLFNGFGTNLQFSITYHPESDGKIERVNQVIEDMIRMYVMNKPSKWEDYLHLVYFTYKNGYQLLSLQGSP
jgi:hypothetical protein